MATTNTNNFDSFHSPTSMPFTRNDSLEFVDENYTYGRDFSNPSPSSVVIHYQYNTTKSEFESSKTTDQFPDSSYKRDFENLLVKWYEERGCNSSLSDIVSCPAYKQIIEMGEPVLPLIFSQIASEEDDPDHWSAALEQITGQDPVPIDAHGDTVKMAAAWLEWEKKSNVW